MGSTTVVIRSFDEPRFRVTEFGNSIVRVTPFEDTRIIVPSDGEDDDEGIFDFTFDNTFE